MKSIGAWSTKAKWARNILLGSLLLALMADLLANERALIASFQGKLYFPILRSYAQEWGALEKPPEPWETSSQKLEPEWEAHPLIPYSPGRTDPEVNAPVGPFESQMEKGVHDRHWLGTDDLGRDLLAGLIHGTRNALLIGVGSMLIAGLLGVFLGAMAGYYGDHKLRLRWGELIIGIPILFLALFYAFYARGYTLASAWESSGLDFSVQLLISSAILFAAFPLTRALSFPLRSIPILKKKFRFPLDMLVMRSIDGLLSIPSLFLILGILAVFRTPSLSLLILVIALLGWCNIARITRAEFLRVREEPFIEAARSVGNPDHRIIFRHALPNVTTPVLIAMSYGVAGAILTGSALSFLGLVPGDLTFWGGILAKASGELSAWWLAVFPGLAIFLLVGSFNVLGEVLQDKKERGSKRKRTAF